jgi:phosphoribosylamine--glycine ligase
MEPAVAFVDELGGVAVVKADGLASGKGVTVASDRAEATAALESCLVSGDFGDAGARVVVEERLEGPEVSAFALVDAASDVPLALSQDHKRLGDGDAGPNTGGMGAYAPVPWFGQREMEAAMESIFEPIAWRMSRDGVPYRGVLYAGLMVTGHGPMVLEFNARFGDPEAQVLMPLLDGDLAGAMLATAAGDRSAMEGSVGMRPAAAAVGVVLASQGYPDAPIAGRPLAGADPAGPDDGGPLLCFHAGTRGGDGGLVTAGGRVTTYVGIGGDHEEARTRAYAAIAEAELEGGQHRSDVGLEVAGA